MRHAVPALIAVLAVIAGCAKPSSAADGGANMVIKQKDGTSLTIPLPAPNGKPEKVAGVSELTGTFLSFCLDAFPDDHAVSAKADQEGFHELFDDQLQAFLKGDPGRGWARRVKDNIVVVSVEDPPLHSCAVRTLLPTEPDMTRMTALAVGVWASQLSPPERLVPRPRVRTAADHGVTEDADRFDLLDGDGHLLETVGIHIAHHPGKDEADIRLVRMRGTSQH